MAELDDVHRLERLEDKVEVVIEEVAAFQQIAASAAEVHALHGLIDQLAARVRQLESHK